MGEHHWFPAYIALGSNLDNPASQLSKAIEKIKQLDELNVIAVSSFYRSAPYGPVEQEDFVNAAIAVLTQQNAETLMHNLLGIEKEMGRERDVRWGPRIIDLDLLIYANESTDTDFLKLPHPEISKRNFVLLPLNDIAPDLMIADVGRVQALLSECDGGAIEKI